MKIGREYRLRRTDRRGAWEKIAAELGVDAARLLQRVLDLAGKIPAALEQATAEEDVTRIESDLPQRLLDGVAARALHCARSLDAG